MDTLVALLLGRMPQHLHERRHYFLDKGSIVFAWSTYHPWNGRLVADSTSSLQVIVKAALEAQRGKYFASCLDQS